MVMEECVVVFGEKDVLPEAAPTVDPVASEPAEAAVATEPVYLRVPVPEPEEYSVVHPPRMSTSLGYILDPTYMDPALWKTMPMHLVELILSKVPFRNLVTMRRVCKYWNALILSEGFSPPFVPALIMFARTPTVRKMMRERNQPVKEKEPRRWRIFRVWNSVRRLFRRKHCGFQ